MRVIKQFNNDQGNRFASIYTDEGQGLLMDVWNGEFETQENLASVLGYSFAQLKSQHLRCWLCDVSQIEGNIEQSADAAKVLFEMLLPTLNLDKFAFVSQRPNHEGRSKLISVLEHHGVQVKVFAGYPAAMEWLLVPSIEEDVWEDTPMLSF